MTDNGDSPPSEKPLKRFGLTGPPPIRPRLLILLLILITASGALWYQNFRLQQRLAAASRQVEGLADFRAGFQDRYRSVCRSFDLCSCVFG